MNVTEPQLFSVVAGLVGGILIYTVSLVHSFRRETRTELSEIRTALSQLAQDVAFIRGQLAPRPEQIRKAEG